MGERESIPQEENEAVDRFGLSRERRIETVETNIDLILRRCVRQDVQPRAMLQRAYKERGEAMSAELGTGVTEILSEINALPDYNLALTSDREQAFQDVRGILARLVDLQITRDFQEPTSVQAAEIQWNRAGLFAYEIGEDGELVLHVPPMTDSPQPNQLKKSLHELAGILSNYPDIQEVRGSSLLLEHPVAKRLGITIDTKSDVGFNPNFRMSRAEFLKRFG